MSGPRCECCNEPNLWALLADEYEFACGVCVEDGQVEECQYTGQWRITAKCGCGKTGPVNYEDNRYYCGGSQYCIP